MELNSQDASKKDQMVVMTIRMHPTDFSQLKDISARHRTTVASLVRGSLVQTGLLKKEVEHGNIR